VLISALALSLIIKTFLIQAFFIPSSSMEDTLAVGDRVLVNKLAPGPFDVSRGDVVVFKDPGGWLPGSSATPSAGGATLRNVLTFVGLLPQDSGEHLIKRVVGMSGDSVACCDAEGRVTVNGVALDEPYLKPGSRPSEVPFDVVVPDGALFVLGDNRQNSGDSRFPGAKTGEGFVPEANVVGVAFTTVWPLDRWSVLRNPEATFAGVPEPGGP